MSLNGALQLRPTKEVSMLTDEDRSDDENLETLEVLVQQTLNHLVDLDITNWEELTELAGPEPIRSAEQRKAVVVTKLYDYLRKNPNRPDARDLDIRCPDHPISKLSRRPKLHGAYARLYRLLDGLAYRMRDQAMSDRKCLTDQFERATTPDECHAAVVAAKAAGFLVRNPVGGKLNHNRNLLGAKKVFAAYVETARRINPRGFPST